MPDANLVQLGTFSPVIAGNIKHRLLSLGVAAEVVPCPGGSCSAKAELWVDPKEVEKIREVVQKEFAKTYAGLEIDMERLGQVYDPDKKTAVCPACGTEFATTSTSCPDCGLCIG